MTRVWFDPQTQHIMIDGVSPKPAQSLVGSWDGYVLWAHEPTGRGIFALPVDQLADSSGNGFLNHELALAYLNTVFEQVLNIDGGNC